MLQNGVKGMFTGNCEALSVVISMGYAWPSCGTPFENTCRFAFRKTSKKGKQPQNHSHRQIA